MTPSDIPPDVLAKLIESLDEITSFDTLMRRCLDHLMERGWQPKLRNGRVEVIGPHAPFPVDFIGALKIEANTWFQESAKKALDEIAKEKGAAR